VPDVSWAEVLLRLALAGALGGVIGAERELRDREAGLRTHMLVAMGAALFTLVSAHAWGEWTFSQRSGVVFDPTRIAAQVVSGIGFLGAGAIIRQGVSVRGLTTAATLWAVAAIGLASGVGYYSAAVITTLLVVIALGPLRVAAHRLVGRYKPSDAGQLAVELRGEATAAPVVAQLEEAGVEIERLTVDDADDRRRVVFDVDLPATVRPVELVEALQRLDGVEAITWRT